MVLGRSILVVIGKFHEHNEAKCFINRNCCMGKGVLAKLNGLNGDILLTIFTSVLGTFNDYCTSELLDEISKLKLYHFQPISGLRRHDWILHLLLQL